MIHPQIPNSHEGRLTSSPRLGRGLVTGLLADGVRLALVLGDTGVNLVDDIRANRGSEHLGEGDSVAGGRAIGADDGDRRSRSHFVRLTTEREAIEVSNREMGFNLQQCEYSVEGQAHLWLVCRLPHDGSVDENNES